MAEKTDERGSFKDVSEGTQPFGYGEQPLSKRGYQPTSGNIDVSNPPQGGSGVSSTSTSDSGGSSQKNE